MDWFVLVVERQRPLSFLSLSVSSQVDDLNHEWKGASVKASQVSTEPYPTIPDCTLPRYYIIQYELHCYYYLKLICCS